MVDRRETIEKEKLNWGTIKEKTRFFYIEIGDTAGTTADLKLTCSKDTGVIL
jgi:hypothetical protein